MPFRLALAFLLLVASAAAQFTADVVVYTDVTSASHQLQVSRLVGHLALGHQGPVLGPRRLGGHVALIWLKAGQGGLGAGQLLALAIKIGFGLIKGLAAG